MYTQQREQHIIKLSSTKCHLFLNNAGLLHLSENTQLLQVVSIAHETKLIHYAVCEVKQILTNMRFAIKEQHSKVPTGLT